ncbi:MAG: hypothetical protein ACTJGD_09020 [Mesonia hippocampi]|uniref:Secreted protein n=1 Tax=Mesonia hippocampi TaxID=1628250 RepID=A0A840EM28_9FLAO|nr:hypothetical protein [Mesonia hippocampi]MBB4118141.1 hypothetical protein [Mesonia hippocampi]
MKILNKIVFVFLLSISTATWAQLDRSTPLPPGGTLNNSLSTDPNENLRMPPGLSTKKSLFQRSKENRELLTKEEEPLSIQNQEVFIEPNVEFNPKYAQNEGKERKMGEEFKRNEYLGEYVSNGEFVKFLCRDHQAVDGDRVKIYLNGKVVVENIFLESQFKGVYLPLEMGFNKIEIEALNQGQSGPNTAAFKVLDDNGGTVSSSEWNLATGYKASIIIVKDE